ncbi:MAG: cell division topological specificity factor MinE [Vulcanimicrobiaceae bacterium]
MVDFFSRIFRRSSSSETARERLKLVLLSDHLALSPETIEALRAELVEVIARYCDIDPASAEVAFEHREQGVEMHATVPVRALHARPRPELKVVPPPPTLPLIETVAPPVVAVAGEPAANAQSPAAPSTDVPTIGKKPRRRRRRKSAYGYQQAPKPAPKAEGRTAQA